MSAGVMMGAGMGMNAYSQYAAGQMSRKLSNANASIADRQSASEVQSGNYNANLSALRTSAIEGQQVNTTGANNLTVSGSALRMVGDTARAGALDALTIRNNALRRAWGFAVQGAGDRYSGAADAASGTLNAMGTFIGGASRAYAMGT